MAKNYSIKAEPWMERMLDDFGENLGYSKVEAFRHALRQLHKREFPQYKKSLTEMRADDPRAYCKSLGGEFNVIDGKDACVITEGTVERIKYI